MGWWTWTYLAVLTFLESGRMVFWVGPQFTSITRSIEAALRAQLVTMTRSRMNQYTGAECMPTDEARKEAQNLVQNMNQNHIIPSLFGIVRFDNLAVTSGKSLLVSAVPTIGKMVWNRATS